MVFKKFLFTEIKRRYIDLYIASSSATRHPLFGAYLDYCIKSFAALGHGSETAQLGTKNDWDFYCSARASQAISKQSLDMCNLLYAFLDASQSHLFLKGFN